MDPFLEHPSVWEEFHHVLITECMYDLGERLPPGYVAKIQERVQSISIADQAANEYVPDVAVARTRTQRHASSQPGTGGGATAVAVKPVTIPAMDAMEVREGHVEILRLPDYELVTSVEILSPWNKFGEGVGIYREKRRGLVQRGVHVVEIDLLLRGTRTELALPLPEGDYYAMVFLGNRHPDVNVYAWRVRDPLPVISAPLKAPDESVAIDLPSVFRSAYDRSHYERKLRYDQELPRGLSPADAQWASELLSAHSRNQ
jgi:hypothetical protein